VANNHKKTKPLKKSNSTSPPLLLRQPPNPSTRTTPANRSLPSDHKTAQPQPRTITYRNGWKQGIILPDGNKQALRQTSGRGADPGGPHAKLRFDPWREAPNLSLEVWLLCLYALPVVTMISVSWLILALHE
jgi:hypothetical protein